MLLGSSVVGFAFFGIAFLISFVRPLLIESAAKDFVRRELEARVQERIESLDGSDLGQLAKRVMERNDVAIAEAKRKLTQQLAEKVAAAVAQMQHPSCDCRRFVSRTATSLLTFDLLARTRANEQLESLIRTKYSEVVGALLREFRIFTAANGLVFLFLAVTTYTKRAAALQLLLPALVLLGAATLIGSLYLFGQDWLHTVVFSDYIGFGYFAYLGAAIVFLTDVVFNRARVTTEILNAGFNLIGAAIQAVPC